MADELWEGARARYVGPDVGALVHGDEVVVEDPGQHRLRSVARLVAGSGRSRPRVLVRLRTGDVVAVRARHLEVLAPAHPLSPEPDGSVAAWVLEGLAPWGRPVVRVESSVPAGFDRVVRVLHPWWRGDDPVRWADVAADAGVALHDLPPAQDPTSTDEVEGAQPPAMRLDHRTAAALVDVLADRTGTPDDVLVAIWMGWGDVPPASWPGAAQLPTEARGHFLLHGPLAGVLEPVGVMGRDPATGMWWPADRSWFVATGVDDLWTTVAGDAAAVEALAAHPHLEVLPTTYDAPVTLGRDRPA